MREWNVQFGIQLVLPRAAEDCKARISVKVKQLQGMWGETINDHGKWSITYSPDTPDAWKPHVVCHEFGHLLGLAHTAEVDSCMNPQITYPSPSRLNLEKAGKNAWQFAE